MLPYERPEPLPRGVYWSRIRMKGRPVMFAVDQTGELVQRVLVFPHDDAVEVMAALMRYLDRVDPITPVDAASPEPAPAPLPPSVSAPPRRARVRRPA